jgi:hypothetical protein
MITSAHMSPAGVAQQSSGATFPIGRYASAIVARAAAWAAALADYHAAAAIYEQLSKLSDAELHRRGLSRETLARDVCGTLG